MNVVAFLQNQWFRDPERVRQMIERNPDRRQQYIARFLFSGCLTGRRLKEAFGDLVDRIVWEESSPEIGGFSASKFKPDTKHIGSVVAKFQPQIVLTFGQIASRGVRDMRPGDIGGEVVFEFEWLAGPHPAAREPGVQYELGQMASWLRKRLSDADAA